MNFQGPIFRHGWMLGMVVFLVRLDAGEQVIRADSSSLPRIDTTKVYEPKTFDGIGKGMELKAVEFKGVQLPSYYGNLQAYPLTEWRAPQSDYYKKSLELKEFEGQRQLQVWSERMKGKLALEEKAQPFSENGSAEGEGKKLATVKAEPLSWENVEKGEDLKGDGLRDIINRGRATLEAPRLKLGGGYQQREIRGRGEVSGTPEKSSPPK